MKPQKLAVFDWNGTLLDDSHANWQAGNDCLALFNVPPISYERYRETMDFPVLHFYTRNGVDADTYLSRFQEAGQVFIEAYLNYSAAAPLKSGATELLARLADEGWHILVLSNFLEDKLRLALAQHHVINYFHGISGNKAFNEIEHSKTNKLERLESYMNDNGFTAERAFIIGDSMEEPELAHKLGLKAISVSWGCFCRQRLSQTNTDFIIDDLAQVPQILLKLGIA